MNSPKSNHTSKVRPRRMVGRRARGQAKPGRATRLKRRRAGDITLPKKNVYDFFMSGFRPYYTRACNLNISREGVERLETPCVVLCCHPSFIDWIYGGLAIWPARASMVITRYYYYNRNLAPLLRSLGAIPKNLFSPDIETIKKIKTIIGMGGCIYLLPEGRLSPHGATETINRSTTKLLKNLGVPVYAIHIDGSYMTKPKWGSGLRRGRVDVRLSRLFTPEQLGELSHDEVYEAIWSALHYDDHAWQQENRVAYKKERGFAEGLHNILYMCPRCGAELHTRTQDDQIRCEACGNGAVLNEYYDLVPLDEKCVIPATIRDWYEWQKRVERGRIEADPAYGISGHAVLKRPGARRKWFGWAGEGKSTLGRGGFTYEGTMYGRPFRLDIPIHTLPALPYGAGEDYEMFSHGEFYYFVPDDVQECVKWSVIAEQLYLHHLAETGGTPEFCGEDHYADEGTAPALSFNQSAAIKQYETERKDKHQ